MNNTNDIMTELHCVITFIMMQAHSVRIGVKTQSCIVSDIIMKETHYVRIIFMIQSQCVGICIMTQAHSVRIHVKTHSHTICNIIIEQSHCVSISIMMQMHCVRCNHTVQVMMLRQIHKAFVISLWNSHTV